MANANSKNPARRKCDCYNSEENTHIRRLCRSMTKRKVQFGEDPCTPRNLRLTQPPLQYHLPSYQRVTHSSWQSNCVAERRSCRQSSASTIDQFHPDD